MARRRGNHEGSLYQRTDGLWCAQVSLNGRRLTKYSRNPTECRLWIKQTLGRIEGGLTYEGTQLTLERFMEIWLEGKELSRRPSTVNGYRRYAGLYILPIMGKERLQDIQPAQIKQLYALMRERGKGARTIQLVHVTLHAALKQAVREGYLGRNPVDAVDRPTAETTEFQVWSEEQARQFLINATGSLYETLFYLALTTGMRKGELLGLKWSDLDEAECTLFVQRQLQRIPHQGYVLVAPKTKAGRRKIKLGPETLKKLKAFQEQQERLRVAAGDKWQENGMMFTSSIGTFLDQTKVSREFKKVLKRAGLPDIRFHDLRHTSLSSLMENDTPVNTVQRRAGHAKASTTVNIYGHASTRSQNEAAEKIEELVVPIKIELQ